MADDLFSAFGSSMCHGFCFLYGQTDKSSVKGVAGAFQKLEDSDLSIRITNKTNDEFEYIYDGFNHMVEKLSQTIDEVYVQKI